MFEDAYSFIRQADAARDSRRWDEARDAYAQALNQDSSLAHIWVQYGHALKESKDVAAAETAYRKALQLAPAVADTHLQLGHALKLAGRRKDAAAAYCKALEIDPAQADARAELVRLAADRTLAPLVRSLASAAGVDFTRQLRCVIVGTMGLCNASCVHCPTGKPETAHVPRMPMPMPLFERLVRSLEDGGYTIAIQMSFGLFGDGLLDPHVMERAKLVREALPAVRLSVNTNGAAYNRARHAPLAEYASVLALHVESLDPETYDKLMQPLRAARVFPKIEQILEDFPGKVAVSIPASRLNRAALPAMREHFLQRGAAYVSFDRLSNRCRSDRSLFESLALAPRPNRCNSGALDDLIVDCDGKVLVCCNDFQRLEPIGDLTCETLSEVMTGARRREIASLLDGGAWERLGTCSRCFADGAVDVD